MRHSTFVDLGPREKRRELDAERLQDLVGDLHQIARIKHQPASGPVRIRELFGRWYLSQVGNPDRRVAISEPLNERSEELEVVNGPAVRDEERLPCGDAALGRPQSFCGQDKSLDKVLDVQPAARGEREPPPSQRPVKGG